MHTLAAILMAAALPARGAGAKASSPSRAPMDPPEWALLERELLRAHTAACVKFFRRYFNQANGWLETTRALGRR